MNATFHSRIIFHITQTLLFVLEMYKFILHCLLFFLSPSILLAMGSPLKKTCGLSLEGFDIKISPKAIDHIIYGDFSYENVKFPKAKDNGNKGVLLSKALPVYVGGMHTFIGFELMKAKIQSMGLEVINPKKEIINGNVNFIKIYTEGNGTEYLAAPPMYGFEVKDNGVGEILLSSQLLSRLILNRIKSRNDEHMAKTNIHSNTSLTFDTPLDGWKITLFPKTISTPEQILDLIQEAINADKADFYASIKEGYYNIDSEVNIEGHSIPVRIVVRSDGEIVTFYPIENFMKLVTIGSLYDRIEDKEFLSSFILEFYLVASTKRERFKNPKVLDNLIQYSYLQLTYMVEKILREGLESYLNQLPKKAGVRTDVSHFFKKWQQKKTRKERLKMVNEFIKKRGFVFSQEQESRFVSMVLSRAFLFFDTRN